MTLPLDIWREIMSFHPFAFWQQGGNSVFQPSNSAQSSSACLGEVYEFAWQAGGLAGRDDIRQAIAVAETKLRGALGYPVQPVQATTTIPAAPGVYQLPDGHVTALGAELLTVLGDAAVTLVDEDGDGVKERFTLTLAHASIAAGDDIRVAVPSGYRPAGAAITERWCIRPVEIDTSAGSVTVRGPAWLLANPRKLTTPKPGMLLVTALDTYLPALTVVKRTIDTSALDGVTLLDGERGLVCVGGACGIPTCLSPSDCGAAPRRSLTYQAGTDDPAWYPIIARLAAAELRTAISACETANQEYYFWQIDLDRAAGKMDEQFNAPAAALSNPFGQRRGHLAAWLAVQRYRHQRGVLV